jgi:hypothetical protein
MTSATSHTDASTKTDVIDFEAALLDACSPDLREELMAEAALLADAFSPNGRAEELDAMAATLCAGARDEEMDRDRARRLAAALRTLARRTET